MKITYLGAGSAVFARQLLTDILAVEDLEGGSFALVDIDPERLDVARRIAERLVARAGGRWTVTATTRRQEVLAGSDLVINSIEVAGRPTVAPDYEIPLRYGVDQCIGDTIGPGGVFKALRTGPEMLDIAGDMARLCPEAILLNYTNPMSILTLAVARVAPIRVVGLCHSVQHTSEKLARVLGVPYEELEWRCAGINHNAWFTELRHEGVDLYPALREAARRPDVYEGDPVRFEVMLRLGAFVTESSGHFSEYVPWFRKRPDLIERYCGPGYLGESGFYAHGWPFWQEEHQRRARAWADGADPLPDERSHEYASQIVEGLALDRPRTIHGNVVNEGWIPNLAGGSCVEVACLVDGRGLHPQPFGPLPEALAALNRSHLAVHELVVAALLEGDRRAALEGLMLDPLTAAVCSLAEIERLFDELWEAERPWLEPFERRASAAAGRRVP